MRVLLVSVSTGCQDAYLISSATRLSFSGPVALRHQITLVLPVRRTFFQCEYLFIKRSKELQLFFWFSQIFFCKFTAHAIKKEHAHLPRMRVLLVSVITGCQDAYLISSATRLSFYSGPVALRHQITLVLPFRRTFFQYEFLLSHPLENCNYFFAEQNIFILHVTLR